MVIKHVGPVPCVGELDLSVELFVLLGFQVRIGQLLALNLNTILQAGREEEEEEKERTQ